MENSGERKTYHETGEKLRGGENGGGETYHKAGEQLRGWGERFQIQPASDLKSRLLPYLATDLEAIWLRFCGALRAFESQAILYKNLRFSANICVLELSLSP